jgi:asparagine synthase (glutamine-hydrolysing)
MCGIAGILRWRAGAALDPAELQAMVASLRHRGPDHEGLLCEGRVGLGMRRLAIQDLSPAGHQPMTSDDGAVTMVFNGEIYDHLDLRSRLVAEGQVFHGTSDTESLVRGYRRFGIDGLLGQIDGMFAFAVLDRPRRKLVFARDAFGVKPLYLRRGPGQISFASEVRALAHDGLGRPSPDPDFLSSYLHTGWVPSPGTAFVGVRKLPAGSLLEIDLDTGVESERRFYELTPEPGLGGLPDDELLARFRERLNWVVRRQLISDVPVGVFLSGGLDSSAILTTATPHLDDRPRAFSMGFQSAETQDETDAAAVIAAATRSEHVIWKLDPTTLEDLGPIQAALEEPIADSAIVPLWHLCRATASQVKVALSGEGGDEALGGYTRYFWGYAAAAASAATAPWREDARPWSTRLGGLLPETPARAHGLANLARRAGKFVHSFGLPEVERYLSWFEVFSPADREALVGRRDQHLSEHVEQIYLRARDRGLDVVQCMQYVDIHTMLIDNLLVKADKLSMAHSLEVRVPLLDRRMVEFGLGLPIRAKIALRGNKPLLRTLLSDRLPRAITRQGKRGFELPVNRWFRDPGTAALRERMRSGALVRGLGFSAGAISDTLRRHQQGDDLGRQVFALAMLETWAEQNT